jgi:hypothetical protein
MSDEAIILDTPEAISAYQMLAVRRALMLEIKTGMMMRRGNAALHTAQAILRNHKRPVPKTKIKAVASLEALMTELNIGFTK